MSTVANEVKYECKHVMYSRANDGSGDDLLTIKENIHHPDGRIEPNLRFIKNYKRPFWVTKPGHRTHKDRTEWEELSKLQLFKSTQAQLVRNVTKAIEKPFLKGGLRQIVQNFPYVYGADISTPTLVKKAYQDKWKEVVSKNSVAALDIETDVVVGHGDPIYCGVTFNDKVFLGVSEDFIKSVKNPEAAIHSAFEKYLGEYKTSRNIKLEVKVYNTVGEMLHRAIQKLHEWQPDFVSIWNIDFDMPRIIRYLEAGGYDLAETFSDPKVPPQFRHFEWVQGSKTKTTAKGVTLPIPVDERWHKVYCPASFHFIDAMCVYRRVRLAKQREPSYALDFQLNKHLNLGKLRFKEADRYTHLDWHIFMQKNYKVEYGVYNIFDCIALELFDEKLMDLALTITVQSGPSEYNIFNSQPKRLVDNLFFYALEEKQRVLSCVGRESEDDLDKYTITRNGWVVTLPSHLRVKSGLKAIRELPDIHSEIHVHVVDADISAGYPTAQKILNLSKETTFRELYRIRGVPFEEQAMASINLIGGHVNAVEVAQSIFKAPSFNTLLEAFEKELNTA